MQRNLLLLGFIALSAGSAAAQELPPVPEALVNTSAVTCVKLSADGAVDGAFIVQSTGDVKKDQLVIDWVRQLHWPKAGAGEKGRGTWFPMPVVFGQATVPSMPEACSPQSPTLPTT